MTATRRRILVNREHHSARRQADGRAAAPPRARDARGACAARRRPRAADAAGAGQRAAGRRQPRPRSARAAHVAGDARRAGAAGAAGPGGPLAGDRTVHALLDAAAAVRRPRGAGPGVGAAVPGLLAAGAPGRPGPPGAPDGDPGDRRVRRPDVRTAAVRGGAHLGPTRPHRHRLRWRTGAGGGRRPVQRAAARGDAGADRVGLRPDSIQLASVDADTGQTVLVALPRNLSGVPFPEDSPMAQVYPDGFDDDEGLLNAVYKEGAARPELYPDAADAGAEATKDAVEAVTGLQVQYHVLVDMEGFSALIDALGGIEVDVGSRVPIGGGRTPEGDPAPITGWIEPGRQRMDGFTALWYARSREGSSDYERIARQRCVMSAMIGQLDPATVLLRFSDIAAASSALVRTDIPQSALGDLADLALSARTYPVVSLQLVPPLVTPGDPDFDEIRALVAEAVAAAEEAPRERAAGRGAGRGRAGRGRAPARGRRARGCRARRRSRRRLRGGMTPPRVVAVVVAYQRRELLRRGADGAGRAVPPGRRGRGCRQRVHRRVRGRRRAPRCRPPTCWCWTATPAARAASRPAWPRALQTHAPTWSGSWTTTPSRSRRRSSSCSPPAPPTPGDPAVARQPGGLDRRPRPPDEHPAPAPGGPRGGTLRGRGRRRRRARPLSLLRLAAGRRRRREQRGPADRRLLHLERRLRVHHAAAAAAAPACTVPASVVVHRTRTSARTDADPGERFYFEVRNKLWLFMRSRGLSAVRAGGLHRLDAAALGADVRAPAAPRRAAPLPAARPAGRAPQPARAPTRRCSPTLGAGERRGGRGRGGSRPVTEPFSLLLPVYARDGPDHLERALRSSVDEQTRRPDEVVLVRDGPVRRALGDAARRAGGRPARCPSGTSTCRRTSGSRAALDRGLEACRARRRRPDGRRRRRLPQRFARQLPLLEAGADLVGSALLEFADAQDRHRRARRARRPAPAHRPLRAVPRPLQPPDGRLPAQRRAARPAATSDLPLMEDYWLFARMIAAGAGWTTSPSRW